MRQLQLWTILSIISQDNYWKVQNIGQKTNYIHSILE